MTSTLHVVILELSITEGGCTGQVVMLQARIAAVSGINLPPSHELSMYRT